MHALFLATEFLMHHIQEMKKAYKLWGVAIIVSIKSVMYKVHSSVRNDGVSYCGPFTALRQTGSGTFICSAPVII